MNDLTPAEQAVIMRMRQLEPFELIEVKLNDNKRGEIAVTVKSTIREVFPGS